MYGVAVIKVTRWDGYGGIDLVGKEMDAPEMKKYQIKCKIQICKNLIFLQKLTTDDPIQLKIQL